MASLRGTRTEANLRTAFSRESEANRRYLWFAEQADVAGHPGVAELFRQLAESETGHALGHLEILAELGDPATGDPLDDTEDHLRSAIAAEAHDAAELYPTFAAVARDEGFDEIAEWLDSLARAEGQQAARLRAELTALVGAGLDGDHEAADRTTGGDVTAETKGTGP